MVDVDVSRSASGPVSLRAFRLTTAFLAAHKEGKFTVERCFPTVSKDVNVQSCKT